MTQPAPRHPSVPVKGPNPHKTASRAVPPPPAAVPQVVLDAIAQTNKTPRKSR